MSGRSVGPARLLDRGQQRREIAERLAHQQVHAAFEQSFDLLAESGPGEPGMRPILDPRRPQRPDRSGDQRLPPGHVPGLAGQLGGRGGSSARPSSPARTRPAGSGSHRRCSSRSRPRPASRYSRWIVETSSGWVRTTSSEAGALGDAAAVEQRPHRAVEEQRPAPQPHPEPLALGQRRRASAAAWPASPAAKAANRSSGDERARSRHAGKPSRSAESWRAECCPGARSRRSCAAPGTG